MRKLLTMFVAAIAVLAVTGCGEPQPQVDPCLSAPDVKQCEAVRVATGGSSSGNNDALLYGVGGYLLGSAMSGGGSSRSTHTTVVRNYYRSTPSYSYRPSYRSSYGGSSFRSSSFRSGGFGRR